MVKWFKNLNVEPWFALLIDIQGLYDNHFHKRSFICISFHKFHPSRQYDTTRRVLVLLGDRARETQRKKVTYFTLPSKTDFSPCSYPDQTKLFLNMLSQISMSSITQSKTTPIHSSIDPCRWTVVRSASLYGSCLRLINKRGTTLHTDDRAVSGRYMAGQRDEPRNWLRLVWPVQLTSGDRLGPESSLATGI